MLSLKLSLQVEHSVNFLLNICWILLIRYGDDKREKGKSRITCDGVWYAL